MGEEFTALDGVPEVTPFIEIQRGVREASYRLVRLAGIDLSDHDNARQRFDPRRPPLAHEDQAYWGILGSLLLWPSAIAAVIKGARDRVLGIAALLSVVTFSFASPYDHWHGRYFIATAIMTAPCTARCLEGWRGRFLSPFLATAVALSSLSATTAVWFRHNRAIVVVPKLSDVKRSIFENDRLEQLLSNRGRMFPVYRRYDSLVPPNAIVAFALPPGTLQYALFGEGLTRRLEPVNVKQMKMPEDAVYFLFSNRLVRPAKGDFALGEGWYLRTLSPAPKTTERRRALATARPNATSGCHTQRGVRGKPLEGGRIEPSR